MRDYLFHGAGELDNLFRQKYSEIKDYIDRIPKEHFAVNSDEKIIEHVAAEFKIDPLTIYPDNRTMSAPTETKVDVSGDRNRFFRGEHAGPFYIDGVHVSLFLPYTGPDGLWHLKPSRSYIGSAPVGKIKTNQQNKGQGEVVLNCTLPSDIGQEAIAQRIKKAFDDELKMISEYVSWSREDVQRYNGSLPERIKGLVETRRKYVSQVQGLAGLLDIPIKADPNAPTILPIALQPRIAVELTPPPKDGLKPEWAIKSELYEKILEIIRHECRTYESAPGTFSKFQEEELRDVLLAHLNGHFKGAATGEAFRKKGKTDICIIQEDRSAFVAECKIWGGAAQLTAALGQLLDYLVWRDCKASIILFNKDVAGFTELLEKVPKTLKASEYFIREVAAGQKGEWRFIFRSKEDRGREITIQVFLINIFVDKKNT